MKECDILGVKHTLTRPNIFRAVKTVNLQDLYACVSGGLAGRAEPAANSSQMPMINHTLDGTAH